MINASQFSHCTKELFSIYGRAKTDSLITQTKGVKILLQKHSINKASGADDIPAYILKETTTELAQYSVIEDGHIT